MPHQACAQGGEYMDLDYSSSGQSEDCETRCLSSVHNHEMLRELGASNVLDCALLGWGKGLEGDINAVSDTAGSEILTKCWLTVKATSSIVTVADPAPA